MSFIYKIRRSIIKSLSTEYIYIVLLIKNFLKKSKNKKVFIDITSIDSNRYLANFIKFWKLNDYTVFIPSDKKLLFKLSRKKGEFRYANLILDEDIKFGKPKQSEFEISANMLSNDYFNTRRSKEIYYLPMSEYPLHYYKKSEIIHYTEQRKNSVFMAGNFDPTFYNSLDFSMFKMPSRRTAYNIFKTSGYFQQINTLNELKFYIQGEEDHRVIIIDTTRDFKIELNSLKIILKEFDFYLGLPGIIIPQSHNLIEAMSVGCIPILDRQYANLFTPRLIHLKTAIIYENTNHFECRLEEIFSLPLEDIIVLRKNVLKYYNGHLAPKAVVNNIRANNYSKIVIQAEQYSLSQ